MNIEEYPIIEVGSTKNLRFVEKASPNRMGKMIMEFTDDTSVGDYGKLGPRTENKGASMCTTAVNTMQALKSIGVPTIFRKQVADNAILVDAVRVMDPDKKDITGIRNNILFPGEMIARDVITETSSAARRLRNRKLHHEALGLPTFPADFPVVLPRTYTEISTKLRKVDEYMSPAEFKKLSKCATTEDMNEADRIVRAVTRFARERGREIGVILFDHKIELAYDSNGRLVVADVPLCLDEITCAFVGQYADLDKFRERTLRIFRPGVNHNLDGVVNASKQPYRDHVNAVDPSWMPRVKKALKGGGKLPRVPHFPEEFLAIMSNIYQAFANEWTGEHHFDVHPLEVCVGEYKKWAVEYYDLRPELSVKTDKLDLVSRMDFAEVDRRRQELECSSPDDGKYGPSTLDLRRKYLSSAAEWTAFAVVQAAYIEARYEFDRKRPRKERKVKWSDVLAVRKASGKVDPLNMALIEEEVTHHDQLAVLDEIGRHVGERIKALLHPGITSYDVVDTARAYLFKGAYKEFLRPKITDTIEKLCKISEKSSDMMLVGRTHLQTTSPLTFSAMCASYAARLADRVEKMDSAFDDLRGKTSGMVGTGAGIEMVIGEGLSEEFEEVALAKLGLRADLTASQVTQKERLADVGNSVVTTMHVLADFANDVRRHYSSEIGELTSRENEERIGGSSTDAMKNNPINWENIAGTASVVEGGMRALYDVIQTDHQRDLRSSKTTRYQPQGMMVEVYEAFIRACKKLDQLSINEDKVAENLEPVRRRPSEAMVTILRGEGWIHPTYGQGHDFVKEMGKQAKRNDAGLFETAFRDEAFKDVFIGLPHNKQRILASGELELYLGHSHVRAARNIEYAREICARTD